MGNKIVTDIDEIEKTEEELWQLINGNVYRKTDLINCISEQRYRLILNSNHAYITNMNSVSHPTIMEKLHLLSLVIQQNGMPKDVYYCIVTEYLKSMNIMAYKCALEIDYKHKSNMYDTLPGNIFVGIPGAVGPSGAVGPIGAVGPSGH